MRGDAARRRSRRRSRRRDDNDATATFDRHTAIGRIPYGTAGLCSLIFIISCDTPVVEVVSKIWNIQLVWYLREMHHWYLRESTIVKGLELAFVLLKRICAHALILFWARPCEHLFQSLAACGWCLHRGACGEILKTQCPSIFMIQGNYKWNV